MRGMVFFCQVFLSDTEDARNSRERGGNIFISLPLLTVHEHSDLHLQRCKWTDYHVFLIASLVIIRLSLNEIYRLEELLFDWLHYESPETMRKLCLSTKFSHQEIVWNYGIFRSVGDEDERVLTSVFLII